MARSVATVLGHERSLEAVTVPVLGANATLATLGKRATPELEALVRTAVLEGEAAGRAIGCGLLSGKNDCESCPQPLDEAAHGTMQVSRSPASATFSRVTCPTAPSFWRWQNLPLPHFEQRTLELPEDDSHLEEWRSQLAAAVACAVFGLAGYFATHHTTSLVFYLASFLAGAWFAAEETWERLQKRAVDVHFLMLAVAAGSASIGAWGEGAMLLFLFSLSGALEHYALGRTQREIRALFKAAPKTAIVLSPTGAETEMPVEQIVRGMRLAIKPDSQFPVDGTVVKGSTAADESNLSGESAPVSKQPGDTVLAGTMNLWGALQIEVTRSASQSALQRIIHLIREAQRSKAPSQRLTDRFGSGYTAVVLVLTVVMFFVWWRAYDLPALVSTPELNSAFYRAMTLLVVASPCALVLSIPSAILAAIAWAARRGILFRGGAAVEMLAEVNIVALDKTGTLTTGELSVESITSLPAGRESEIAGVAYSLANHSAHPLSRAISQHGRREHWHLQEPADFESISGQGVVAHLRGERCLMGRREFIASLASEDARAQLREWPADSASQLAQPEVWIATGEFVGKIQLRDEVRPQATELLVALRQAGLRTVLLTGDRQRNADAIQKLLPLDEVRAELHPDDKLRYIVKQNEAGQRVAMIGDGVNDAPSLAAAHVGVAMGARGSDAALEQADIVLMQDRLENFLAAFQLSQRARRIIQQNLFISLGTVIVLVGLALAGQIPLTLGVLGHEGSTVVVVLNSLRLLFKKSTSSLSTSSS